MKSETTKSGSRPVIVLGMERSGTSLVAQLVHQWGAYAGKDVWRLQEGDQHNPQGYWENYSLSDFLHDELTAGGPDRAVLSPYHDDALNSKAMDPQYRRKALRLISEMEEASDVWFWKEPGLSIQLAFWKHVWGDAAYIVTVRNPYDSSVSIQKYLGFRDHRYLAGKFSFIAANLTRWQLYMLSILRHIDESPRKIFFCYEDLMKDPQAGCRKLCEYLDRHTGSSSDEDSKIENMMRAVNSNCWRNRSLVALADVEEATAKQADLYNLLLKKVEDADFPFMLEDYPLPSGWRGHLANYLAYVSFCKDVMDSQAFPLVRCALAVNRSLAWLVENSRNALGWASRGVR